VLGLLGTEADLDRKLRAVLASAQELRSDAHGSGSGISSDRRDRWSAFICRAQVGVAGGDDHEVGRENEGAPRGGLREQLEVRGGRLQASDGGVKWHRPASMTAALPGPRSLRRVAPFAAQRTVQSVRVDATGASYGSENGLHRRDRKLARKVLGGGSSDERVGSPCFDFGTSYGSRA
jgi:hypothetical protein